MLYCYYSNSKPINNNKFMLIKYDDNNNKFRSLFSRKVGFMISIRNVLLLI
jgi:hypothetical protein